MPSILPSSASTLLTGWPADVPAFRGVRLPDRLRVPLGGGGRHSAQIERAGRSIRAGERLVGDDDDHVPLAPADGRTGENVHTPLAGCGARAAVELFVDHSVESRDADQALAPMGADVALEELGSIRRGDLPAWIDRLCGAGVWSDRRASPDLLGQLLLALRRPIDTVLCNLLDTDPFACLNTALAARYGRELAAGLNVLTKITGATQTWVVADARVPGKWLRTFHRLARKSGMRLVAMPNDYPQPDPTLLMYSLLGRRLRPGRLPVEVAVLVVDAAAAVAVGRCAALNEPMLRVPLAVRDYPRRKAHFLFATIGMSIGDVLDGLAIHDRTALLRCGDILRDVRLSSDSVIGGGELVVHVSDPDPATNPDPCIRCGWCIEACPTGVQPAHVLEAAQFDDALMAERAGIEACIECGICSFVCPSRLPLLQAIRIMRAGPRGT